MEKEEQLFGAVVWSRVSDRSPGSTSDQLPSKRTIWEAAEDASSTWVAVVQVGDTVGVPSSCLWPHPASTVAGIWGVNQEMEGFSLSLPSK